MYIVGKVIVKIAITGHHPRIDDVARHLERGARLIPLFAELGNLFRSCSSFFHPKITDCTSGPLRFGPCLSNNALIVAFRRRLWWFCQGSQSALRFHRIYLLLRRWMSLCFQPLKPVIHFGSRNLCILLRVLSYELGNLFPSCSSLFHPLITDCTSRPLRFGPCLSN